MRTFVFIMFLGLMPQALSQTVETTSSEAIIDDLSAAVSPQPVVDALPNTLIESAPPTVKIPFKTPVRFTLDTEISSKTAMPGNQFQLKVSEDLVINGIVAIPGGTPATGEIIHAQKAGGFGKPGELLLAIRYIDLHGQQIKMRSFQPLQGKSNSNAVMATSFVPYVGLFAGFIQGGQIVMPENTLVQALVASETSIHLQQKNDNKIDTPQPQDSAPQPTGDTQ
ncbi:MAG: hypothetical protein ACREPB_06755 [Arenimonas sp.]